MYISSFIVIISILVFLKYYYKMLGDQKKLTPKTLKQSGLEFKKGAMVFVLYHVPSSNSAQHHNAVSHAVRRESPGDFEAAAAYRRARDNVYPGMNMGALVAENYSGFGPVRLQIGKYIEEVHLNVVSHYGPDVSHLTQMRLLECGTSWSEEFIIPSVKTDLDTFKDLFVSGEMSKNDQHAASLSCLISKMVDDWMYSTDNGAFESEKWCFEKEAVYTYWALFQPHQELAGYASAWTTEKMFLTFWDSRPTVKTFGNNSLLSKYLWVKDKRNNDRLTTAFAIDASADRLGTVKISRRRADETDHDFLKRNRGNIHRKTGGGSNLDLFVDCQLYQSFKKELKCAQKKGLKIEEYPPHLKDVEQWSVEHKWLEKESGGIIKLFEYLPLRFRQRVVNDDYESCFWLAGGRKHKDGEPGYIGTCQSATKDVGLLLRILACFTQDPDRIHQPSTMTELPSRKDEKGTEDLKRHVALFVDHLLGSQKHDGTLSASPSFQPQHISSVPPSTAPLLHHLLSYFIFALQIGKHCIECLGTVTPANFTSRKAYLSTTTTHPPFMKVKESC